MADNGDVDPTQLTHDIDEPANLRAWSNAEVIAGVLLAGVAFAAICCMLGAAYSWINWTVGPPPDVRWQQAGLAFGAFNGIGIVLLLAATATLWWQQRVLSDQFDDEGSVAAGSANRLAFLLRATIVLLALTAIGSLSRVLGFYAEFHAQGSPTMLVGPTIANMAVDCAVIAGCLAGYVAIRSTNEDLSTLRLAATLLPES